MCKTCCSLTYGQSGWQADPEGLVVSAHQLLPHEEHRDDVECIRHTLVDDHENDGGAPPAIHRHCPIDVACTGLTSEKCRLEASASAKTNLIACRCGQADMGLCCCTLLHADNIIVCRPVCHCITTCDCDYDD